MKQHHDGTIDRLPPHSNEAEQSVLGCLLMSPNGCIDMAEAKLGKEGEPFYDLRHQTLFRKIVRLHDDRIPIDMVTLSESLRKSDQLDQVGGLSYITTLEDIPPSSANLPEYLDIVLTKFQARRVIQTATEVVSRLYDRNGDDTHAISRSQAQLLDVLSPMGRSVVQQHWRIKDLIGYDVNNDPNAVIGVNDGKTTRYLCRGYSAWLIGQSGIGKSSLGQQMCFYFALGKTFFGIKPVRKLRCLIIQNENDEGDCAENTQGILDSGHFTVEEFEELHQHVKIIRCRGKTGAEFCRFLEAEVVAWNADVVYVDPLLRFAGIDVSRQDQCTKFLNDNMDPVLARTGVVMIGAHHTGKPKQAKETKGWTIYDMAYSGIGSSELVNWARAILILKAAEDQNFELLLAKRGSRAWATDLQGNPTINIHLKHSADRIFWEQTDPPEVPMPAAPGKVGRKSVVHEIAAMNLFEFCNECKPEGEGLREISRRLETYLSTVRIDASHNTCRRAISLLVANGKLVKNPDSLYLKGPEA